MPGQCELGILQLMPCEGVSDAPEFRWRWTRRFLSGDWNPIAPRAGPGDTQGCSGRPASTN